MKTRFCMITLLSASLGLVALTGMNCPPTITLPTDFTNADLVRGGLLYDKWWTVVGASAPTTDHPLWASRPDTTSNTRTGADTWRCKECHGWDYKGVSGAYATGSHKTGIKGIYMTTLGAQAVFDLLKNDSTTTTNGHGFGSAGLSDAELWNLTRFVIDDQFDTSTIIDSAGKFTGSATTGQTLYTTGIGTGTACSACHGTDGKTIPPGAPTTFNAWVGKLSNDNPWEFQHKVRFGQPGATAMPAALSNGGTTTDVNDLGAHSQTLPQT
ncbi:MAG: c-type cytochrome [Phycisphaerae bacterium]